jgi:hypothetical protein
MVQGSGHSQDRIRPVQDYGLKEGQGRQAGPWQISAANWPRVTEGTARNRAVVPAGLAPPPPPPRLCYPVKKAWVESRRGEAPGFGFARARSRALPRGGPTNGGGPPRSS